MNMEGFGVPKAPKVERSVPGVEVVSNENLLEELEEDALRALNILGKLKQMREEALINGTPDELKDIDRRIEKFQEHHNDITEWQRSIRKEIADSEMPTLQ